ncbi:hypothetical protein RUM43_011086 [Polyplax serrata]|uniref:Uncharacterized protein n=1 Tax=Polyplax serrata TaxID=468196 RepID=A0AAN8RZT8_POLSC
MENGNRRFFQLNGDKGKKRGVNFFLLLMFVVLHLCSIFHQVLTIGILAVVARVAMDTELTREGVEKRSDDENMMIIIGGTEASGHFRSC